MLAKKHAKKRNDCVKRSKHGRNVKTVEDRLFEIELANKNDFERLRKIEVELNEMKKQREEIRKEFEKHDELLVDLMVNQQYSNKQIQKLIKQTKDLQISMDKIHLN